MSEINDKEEIPEINFPINFKLIQQHQRLERSIMAKYKNGMYHKDYFHGVGNDNLSLIICKDQIVLSSKLQGYVITLLPYVYPYSSNGYNVVGYSPTFLLA